MDTALTVDNSTTAVAGNSVAELLWPATSPQLLSLLWLSSPTLPTGAFAFSQGLEYCFSAGIITTAADLQAYLADELNLVWPYWDLPLLKRMYETLAMVPATQVTATHWQKCQRLNELLLSGRESKELLQEELSVGNALKRLLLHLKVLPEVISNELQAYSSCGAVLGWALFAAFMPQQIGSFQPPLVEVQRAAVPPHAAQESVAGNSVALLQSYTFALVQGAICTACKAMPLGQNAGQEVLLHLLPLLPPAITTALHVTDEDMGCALPLTAIASACHETQYARIFRS